MHRYDISQVLVLLSRFFSVMAIYLRQSLGRETSVGRDQVLAVLESVLNIKS